MRFIRSRALWAEAKKAGRESPYTNAHLILLAGLDCDQEISSMAQFVMSHSAFRIDLSNCCNRSGIKKHLEALSI